MLLWLKNCAAPGITGILSPGITGILWLLIQTHSPNPGKAAHISVKLPQLHESAPWIWWFTPLCLLSGLCCVPRSDSSNTSLCEKPRESLWKALPAPALSVERGGEKNVGYQPSCRNSSRYSAWSSDPEGAGGSKDASVHSSLWCKAEAQLSCQVNLKIQVFPKPQKEHSWGQPNSDMSVLWVLTLPHIRATLPLCKGFFLP